MSEISEKGIKLIKDLWRDISIDIMFTPKENARVSSRSVTALTDYIAELESERRWKDSNVELPTEDTDGNTLLVIYRHSGEWAKAPFGVEYSDEFVRHYSHWMYAPELPEVEQ